MKDKTIEKVYVRTDYLCHAAAACAGHGEHVVSGRCSDKKQVGNLKNDLCNILRNDWPDCKLRPKPFLDKACPVYRTLTPRKPQTV